MSKKTVDVLDDAILELENKIVSDTDNLVYLTNIFNDAKLNLENAQKDLDEAKLLAIDLANVKAINKAPKA